MLQDLHNFWTIMQDFDKVKKKLAKPKWLANISYSLTCYYSISNVMDVNKPWQFHTYNLHSQRNHLEQKQRR